MEFENKYNILRSIKSDKFLAPKCCYYIQMCNKNVKTFMTLATQIASTRQKPEVRNWLKSVFPRRMDEWDIKCLYICTSGPTV